MAKDAAARKLAVLFYGTLAAIVAAAVAWSAFAPVEWRAWVARNIAGLRESLGDDPSGGAFDGPESGMTEASMRAAGFHCPGPTRMERTAIRADGSKVYRLTCGYGGPYYEVIVRPDGGQAVTPLD